MPDPLSARIAELAADGLCVKVGNWCSRMVCEEGRWRQVELLPKPIRYHASLTGLDRPGQWGFTAQGWGDTPMEALEAAVQRRRELAGVSEA